MRVKQVFILLVLVPFLFVGFMACGGGGSDSDSTAPTVLDVQPGTGPINGSTEIIVTFDESMDTGSLILGGDLGLSSDNGTWSSTSVTDDTLAVAPFSTWSAGSNEILTVDAQDLAGNALVTLNLSYIVDTSVPVVIASPAGGSVLQSSDTVVLSFSESMNSISLSISGTLAQESDGGVWSSLISAADTLIISPSGTWTIASGRTLDLDAEDLAGNPVSTLNLTYDVGECVPASTQNRSCIPSGGSIICEPGTQTRTCGSTGIWGAWGSCTGGLAVNPPAVCP